MARDNITDKGSTKISPWFGHKYRVTPESSKLLQEAVFADGGSWLSGSTEVQRLEMKYLYTKENGKLTYDTDYDSFQSDHRAEKEPPQVERKTLQENTVSVIMIPTDVNSVIKHFNQQEETIMSTNTQRKTVTVNLIDRDSALDEKFALVATFGEFTTSKSPEALIRSIIIDPKNDVAKLIAEHNEVRVKQTNKEIMERTGNKVTLEAIEESDLHWEIR